MITQVCPECGPQPLEAFTPSKRGKKGEMCRACNQEYMRRYYQANKSRLDERNRAHREQHRDAHIAYQRQYRADHPDLYARRRPYYQQHYIANRNGIRARQRDYQRQHPELGARHTMRYYGRKKGAQGNHTAEEWRALRAWFGNRCLRCGATERPELLLISCCSAKDNREWWLAEHDVAAQFDGQLRAMLGRVACRTYIMAHYRKPQPGMLLAGLRELGGSAGIYVGNMETDRQAAEAARMGYLDTAEWRGNIQ